MWIKQKFFKISVGILIILLIIFLFIQLNPIFSFIFKFIETLLLPLIIAGVLYYILRPLCQFLERKQIPRVLSIGIIYLLFFGLVAFAITYIWPYISEQFSELYSFPKEKLKEFENKTVDIMNLFNFTSMTNEQLRQALMFYLRKFTTLITENLTFTISSVATIASYFIITPFILYYFLKDDRKMSASLLNTAPRSYKKISKTILNDIDYTLSSYITGQVMVSIIVSILIFFGYWAIGLHYAFLLALIAFLFNLIPFGGPIISTIPALFIGLGISPFMGFKVIAVVAFVHLLDLNLISPRIVGPRLQIHPITIILLLVASLATLGFLGLFLIIPIYAVLKVIITDIYELKFSNNEEPS